MALKVAFWALGLLVFGLFGLVLINLFGNITTTNQFNYTTLKNSVQAAMYDSLDSSYFNAGFCVCTDKSMDSGKWVFNDSKEYELVDIKYVDQKETCDSTKKYCKILFGEYRINKDAFKELVVERFSRLVSNNKKYQMVIQDINEYPPKVSVGVISYDDEYSPTEKDSDGYNITNRIDAIIETYGNVQVIDQPTKNMKIALTCPTNSGGNGNSGGSSTESGGSGSSFSGNCTWHHNTATVKCSKGSDTYTTSVDSRQGFSTCVEAVNSCEARAKSACRSGYTPSYSCTGYQTWTYKYANGTGGEFSKTCGAAGNNNYSCPATAVSCNCKG